MSQNLVVAVISGGMDSTVLAHHLHDAGADVRAISFDYGQRHRKELDFAERCASRLNSDFKLVDLTSINDLVGNSSLTSDAIEIPDGHYAADSMKSTVVPNRNAIMIAIAAGYAVSIGAESVAVGVHSGDHFIYPDCRPGFIRAMDTALFLGNEGFASAGFHLSAPFVDMSKTDIALRGAELGVPWGETWSCYRGESVHCGRCGTCVERREAFTDAGIDDPTEYESTRETAAPGRAGG